MLMRPDDIQFNALFRIHKFLPKDLIGIIFNPPHQFPHFLINLYKKSKKNKKKIYSFNLTNLIPVHIIPKNIFEEHVGKLILCHNLFTSDVIVVPYSFRPKKIIGNTCGLNFGIQFLARQFQIVDFLLITVHSFGGICLCFCLWVCSEVPAGTADFCSLLFDAFQSLFWVR
jgi:hypothetical protein